MFYHQLNNNETKVTKEKVQVFVKCITNLTTPFMVLVSHPLIAFIIPFADISNTFKWKNIYIMRFRVANWNTLGDSLAF